MTVDFKKQGQVVDDVSDFWTAEDILEEKEVHGVYLGIIKQSRQIYGQDTELDCPLVAFETESGGFIKKTLPSHSDLLRKLRQIRELSAVLISIEKTPVKRNEKFVYKVVAIPPDQYNVPEELIQEAQSLKK